MKLSYHLYSKQKLQFKDGKFKILMLSDIQETLDFHEKTKANMDKLVERVQPDFVMLGGDNCDGHILKTRKELTEYLKIMASPMEKRQIPWAHVFGNHDHDMALNDLEATRLYEACDFCVSKHTEDIYGTTNFVLPVYNTMGNKIALNLWGLDSNNLMTDTALSYQKNMDSFQRESTSGSWDIVHFEQLMWYWNTSKELEKYNGERINGILFMHISPWEFQYIVSNPDLTKAKGSMVERLDLGMFNSGLFATVLQRGDIKCIACGHTHKDCFEGDFCGVKMCLDACAGYSPYGIDSLRGGRVFEIDETDTSIIHTYMLHYDNS